MSKPKKSSKKGRVRPDTSLGKPMRLQRDHPPVMTAPSPAPATTPHLKVSISPATVVVGTPFEVVVEFSDADQVGQVQVDLGSCAVLNPDAVWGSGSDCDPATPGVKRFTVATEGMTPGFLEVKHVQLRAAGTMDGPHFFPGKDFPRSVVHLREPDATLVHDVLAAVTYAEKMIEDEFCRGLVVPGPGSPEALIRFSVFVFAAGVLVGGRLRFHRWEVGPFQGMDARDPVDTVNRFLAEQTICRVQFAYAGQLQESARRSSPVLVANFPGVFALTSDMAGRYAEKLMLAALDALSLERGAAGRILAIVVVDPPRPNQPESALMLTPLSQYLGNLLTGHLSGESAESVERLLTKSRNEPQARFILSLLRAAHSEQSHAHMYWRFWTVIEAITDSMPWAKSDAVTDSAGQVVRDGSNKPVECRGRWAAYRLLVESGMHQGMPAGLSISEYVAAWHGFRHAAAHFGGYNPAEPDRLEFPWARAACAQAVAAQGGQVYGEILDDIRRRTKDVVRWFLRGPAVANPPAPVAAVSQQSAP